MKPNHRFLLLHAILNRSNVLFVLFLFTTTLPLFAQSFNTDAESAKAYAKAVERNINALQPLLIESEEFDKIIQENLKRKKHPTDSLMLAIGIDRAILKQLPEAPSHTWPDYFRLLRWVGSENGHKVLEALPEEKIHDRYDFVRTLVTLDSPNAEYHAMQLLQTNPIWGAPLVANLQSRKAVTAARSLLRSPNPDHWRGAAWILGNSHDPEQLLFTERRLYLLGSRYKEVARELETALRRLQVERRDFRLEALGEYLEDSQDTSLDDRLWCITEIGRWGESSEVFPLLKKEPYISRSKKKDIEAAAILWSLFQAGDPLSTEQWEHLCKHRYHLGWIPSATRWPPVIKKSEEEN